MVSDVTKQVALKHDRIAYWLSVGAQPSETVRQLLEKHARPEAQSEA